MESVFEQLKVFAAYICSVAEQELTNGTISPDKTPYTNEKDYLTAILEYLRVSIVAILACALQKEKYLEDLDNSLIDNECEKSLKEKLVPALSII